MIRRYEIASGTTGKIHVVVYDAWTGHRISSGIWSMGEIPAALAFLQDYLTDDASHCVPRIAPELPEDFNGGSVDDMEMFDSGWPKRTWLIEDGEAGEVMERSM